MNTTKGVFPVYYSSYIALVEHSDPIDGMLFSGDKRNEILTDLPADRWEYRYEDGKWTPKEILMHVADAERIFAYRALRFARNDETELMGYDHDSYVPQTNANDRPIGDIISELDSVRSASVSLFQSFSTEQLERSGVANGVTLDVRAIGFIIAGHETHHLKVIKERYF